MGSSKTQVLVLEAATLASNQRHTLTVFPRTRLLSIVGNCFATNKSFRPREQGVVEWFQQTRSLDGEGTMDEATRRKLIEEYMAQATPTLEEGEITNPITAHGCGESFPVEDSGSEFDADAADGQSESEDRRVEFQSSKARPSSCPSRARASTPCTRRASVTRRRVLPSARRSSTAASDCTSGCLD
jgi:hypothetical protein